MGIFQFYSWFRKTFPEDIYKVDKYIHTELSLEIDNLLIDMNGLFHTSAQKVFKYGSFKPHYDVIIKENNKTHQLVFKDICETLENILMTVNPRRKIILCVDGPAPMAKQCQQRKRRYKSSLERGDDDKSFDSNQMTPGTKFMDHLSKYIDWFIRKRISENPFWQNIEIIYSPSSVPSEGEQKLLSYIRKFGDKNESYVMHGLDSVSGDTPLLLKNINNDIEIKTIETLSTEWISRDCGKEYSETNFQVWTENGWTKIKTVMRHKVTKNLYRVNTHTGVVDVTEDHSLLNIEKKSVKPIDCSIGDKLLHHFPSFEENKICLDVDNLENKNIKELYKIASSFHISNYQKVTKKELIEKIKNSIESKIFCDLNKKTEITEKESYIMGLFWADGSCGIYESKKNKKYLLYQWYISNCDLELLKSIKTDLEECYNHSCAIFEDKSKQKRQNVQKSYKLRINGGKSMKYVIDKYINMFYYKNKHPKYKNGNKYICPEILNSPKVIRESFLKGVYAGDGKGHDINKKTKKEIDVESKISSQSIFFLCKSLGYNVSIIIRSDKMNVYKLTITKLYLQKDENVIKKIFDLGKTEQYVYDLETENHHFQAGVGQMIVHNSDLIMLSLLTHYSKFYVLRDDTFDHKNNFLLVDIGSVREKLVNLMKWEKSEDSLFDFKFNKEWVINDFVFLCFITGNDFLPHIPSIEIIEGGVEVIIEISKNVGRTHGHITRNKTGNIVFCKSSLKKFLEIVADSEKELLEQKFKNRSRYFEDKILEKSATYNASENKYEINIDKFRSCYNEEIFQNEEYLEKASYDYLGGLQWILKYYTKEVPSWRWYFPYHYAPTASTLVKYIDSFEFPRCFKGSPLTPLQQLLCVLPPKSSKLLPYPLDSLLSTKLKRFNPDDVEIDVSGKKHEYMGIVKLPFIDFGVVKKVYDENISKVDERELRRNNLGKSLHYIYDFDNERIFKSYYGDIEKCMVTVKVIEF